MNKKLFASLCCLVPVGAVNAAPTYIFESPYVDGDLVATAGTTDGTSYVITQGPAQLPDGQPNPDAGKILPVGGLHVNGTVNLEGGLSVGLAESNNSNGWLYVLQDYLAQHNNAFTFSSSGDMTIGTVDIESGFSLALQGSGSNTLDVTTSIIADGALNITNFATANLGTVNAADVFNVSAVNDLTVATMNVSGNSASINVINSFTASGDVVFNGANAGSYSIIAGTASGESVTGGNIEIDGNLQNQSAGDLVVKTGGDITVGGAIQNMGVGGGTTSGGNMTVSAGGNITADAITQAFSGSTLNVNAGGDLTLNGTEDGGSSLVLNGTVDIDVVGTTTITNGWKLNDGGESFSLTTSTLVFKSVDSDTFADMFTNNWDNFALDITNGSLNVSGTTIANQSGNMSIKAASGISAAAVINGIKDAQGTINGGGSLELLSTGGNITIGGAIDSAAGTTTTISTTKTLTAGDVTNNGIMTLGGATITLDSVVNNAGGTLTVSGYRDAGASPYASITVYGDVENAGTLNMTASSLTINGLLSNTGGTGTITGNATTAGVSVGQVEVTGGVLNMDSLAGGITIDGTGNNGNGTLVVRGGVLNFGGNTSSVTATGGDIDIAGNVTVGGTAATGVGNVNIAATGTNGFTMTATNGNINIGGDMTAMGGLSRHATFVSDLISVGGDVTAAGWLTFGNATSATNAASNLTVAGIMTANQSGWIDVYMAKLNATAVNSDGGKYVMYGQELIADSINLGTSDKAIDGLWFTSDAGSATSGMFFGSDVNSFTITTNTADGINIAGGMTVGSGKTLTLNTDSVDVGGDVIVAGTFNQGGAAISNGLNLTQGGTFTAGTLTVNGNFKANANNVAYTITGNGTPATSTDNIVLGGGYTGDVVMNVAGNMDVASGATVSIAAAGGYVATQNLTNSGMLSLSGKGMKIKNALTAGTLYQQANALALKQGDINITQKGNYTFYVSDVTLDAIYGSDISFIAWGSDNLLNVNIAGDVSGGVDFVGLESMSIGGDWTFNSNNKLGAWIKSQSTGASYWSTVDDDPESANYGKITNKSNGAALITVGGTLYTDLDFMRNGLPAAPDALADQQIGISITDIIDQGDAIWLVHAEGNDSSDPIQEMADLIRNLYVRFCNYNGTICYNYFDSLQTPGTTDPNDWPAYVSVRDTDGDGIADSIYIVFDPEFGGPIEVFKIQPIVDRVPNHTEGEYASAGALDDLIEGKLLDTGFFNRTPIEVIPLVFKGTNMETLMNELYNRMEDYATERDGTALARFSRLVQPREIEQVAGSVVMNEHTTFRDFEDRMFDEFIWNRNRNLKKAWVDVDYGMFTQDVSDNKRVDGNRFSLAAGFDWQETNTLILGVTARVSRMSGDNSDAINLSYKPNENIFGSVDVSVVDTDLAIGAYMMQTLGDKSRLYGNAFLDLHLLDVSRDMTYMSHINGDGTAVSLISEWGLLHDILNQYIVGNLYARIGYNFGFSITEKAQGQDYMTLESDGYMILTPGYTLTAQKRIYPSSWMQIRPYASIGIEYDVLGAPDRVQYKFAPARNFTDYKLSLDPLWANIGGGIEVLSVNGVQVGLDYRYQYNQDMQLHNIKLSGSYRF